MSEQENYVLAHKSANEFDLQIGFQLLKSYAIQPSSANAHAVAVVLVHCLMELPETTFQLATNLVPRRVCADPDVSAVLRLGELLESTDFETFWPSVGALKIAVDGFEQAIRHYVVDCYSMTYTRCDKESFSRALNLSGDALNTFVAKDDRIKIDGSFVLFHRAAERPQLLQSRCSTAYMESALGAAVI
eukprot:c9584_g1_i1.p1 GENE.c9584_g1_i1~~c9584_g1_i1.p1  ORF type:complete len:189 (-),score=31.75 c9584_g1_i1:52-618(-)